MDAVRRADAVAGCQRGFEPVAQRRLVERSQGTTGRQDG